MKTKSTHRVEVVPIHLEKHPNADALSVVTIWGYTCCVRTQDWESRQHSYGFWGTSRYLARFKHFPDRVPLGAYLPPDSVVPDTEDYKFLDGHLRIKAKRLRGVVSMGLLVPAPAGTIPGDDVAERLGVQHWEPQMKGVKGLNTEQCSPPPGYHPVYDVDALRRYSSAKHDTSCFVHGEPVWVTEKIHGTNARFTAVDTVMFAGSHNHWRRQDPGSLYWKILETHPEVEAWCQANPGYTLYGEIYGGGIQKGFDYGCAPGQYKLALFDVLDTAGKWVNPADARLRTALLPWVPSLGIHSFDLEAINALAEGPSLVSGAQHIREGVVVKPVEERSLPRVGRLNLKVVGIGYYEKK